MYALSARDAIFRNSIFLALVRERTNEKWSIVLTTTTADYNKWHLMCAHRLVNFPFYWTGIYMLFIIFLHIYFNNECVSYRPLSLHRCLTTPTAYTLPQPLAIFCFHFNSIFLLRGVPGADNIQMCSVGIFFFVLINPFHVYFKRKLIDIVLQLVVRMWHWDRCGECECAFSCRCCSYHCHRIA